MKWNEMKWNEMKWNEMKRNEKKWEELKSNEMRWNGMKWNEVMWNRMKLEQKQQTWQKHLTQGNQNSKQAERTHTAYKPRNINSGQHAQRNNFVNIN